MTNTSRQQKMEALDEANDVRVKRAVVKRELRSRSLSLAEALERPCVQTMRLTKLLLAVPHIGKVKAHKIQTALGLRPYKPVGELTESQRREVVALVAYRRKP